jgi:hypothetical protein
MQPSYSQSLRHACRNADASGRAKLLHPRVEPPISNLPFLGNHDRTKAPGKGQIRSKEVKIALLQFPKHLAVASPKRGFPRGMDTEFLRLYHFDSF